MGKKSDDHVIWFNEIGIDDVDIVGGKTASLGEMYKSLTPKGVAIPNGFGITSDAYFYFLDSAGIRDRIHELMKGLDVEDSRNLSERGEKVRKLIKSCHLPDDLEKKIKDAYDQLCKEVGAEDTDVAVRSSATAEDLPNASFAGQQETFLNIRGHDELMKACIDCIASLFTNRAIAYRESHGFDHFQVGLSVCVQMMVRSDLASSGVLFTLDTESGFEKVVFITGAWGLGENIVQGKVDPDEFYVFKPMLDVKGRRPIISRRLGSKEQTMVYKDVSSSSRNPVKNVRTKREDRERFCLDDDDVLTLARWAVEIEDHYSLKKGHYTPMDIEWAKDGRDGSLYIVQARAETIHSQRDRGKIKTYRMKEKYSKKDIVAKGQSVGSSIACGPARVLQSASMIDQFKKGEVLVTDMTDPDWAPIMKRAAAIVTNRGGRTCHAAITSREFGIPCIVGCHDVTERVHDGDMITVNCADGETGFILKGEREFAVDETNAAEIPKTETKPMLIVGNPETAFSLSGLPAQGVGLVRMEFMVTNHIQVHPLALLNMDKLSVKERHQVRELTKGYESGEEFFLSKLSEGIACIAAAFYPHEVTLRFSDFKTNEYANLVGGQYFEPNEENPMLGWRGASRYYDEQYKPGFRLECEAVKRVRERFGLDNLVVMIPFVRTVKEAERVLQTMEEFGLERSKDGLKVYAMCEIPSNVLLADQFLDVLDGFSIGSNDLTQLVLGVDRDSDLVSHLYDERDEAVKIMVKRAIEVARQKNKYIGICGQVPSDHPEFCDFLVREGITSISVSSDRLLETILRIAEAEKQH
eukprot:m.168025 g.168025  ORF g.168025 m.168025 type:complete len:809 (+) comp16462_c0_seq12:63-2489(+)